MQEPGYSCPARDDGPYSALDRASRSARWASQPLGAYGAGGVDLHAQLRDGQGAVGLVEVEGEQLVQLADEAGDELGVGGGPVGGPLGGFTVGVGGGPVPGRHGGGSLRKMGGHGRAVCSRCMCSSTARSR